MPVPARVIRVAGVSAMAAFFSMAAEGCSTADLDGAHGAQLPQRQGVRPAILRAVLLKYVGHLQRWPRSHARRDRATCRWVFFHDPARSCSAGLAMEAILAGETAV
jgi:hypothetical protein